MIVLLRSKWSLLPLARRQQTIWKIARKDLFLDNIHLSLSISSWVASSNMLFIRVSMTCGKQGTWHIPDKEVIVWYRISGVHRGGGRGRRCSVDIQNFSLHHFLFAHPLPVQNKNYGEYVLIIFIIFIKFNIYHNDQYTLTFKMRVCKIFTV